MTDSFQIRSIVTTEITTVQIGYALRRYVFSLLGLEYNVNHQYSVLSNVGKYSYIDKKKVSDNQMIAHMIQAANLLTMGIALIGPTEDYDINDPEFKAAMQYVFALDGIKTIGM